MAHELILFAIYSGYSVDNKIADCEGELFFAFLVGQEPLTQKFSDTVYNEI